MKNIYKKILLIICSILIIFTFLLSTIDTKAQDIHFSQFYYSPLTMNPALTGGFNGGVRVLTSYRDQWKSISANPYKTFMLSGDYGFKKSTSSGFLAGGLTLLSDKAGLSQLAMTQVNLSVAYHVQLSAYNTLSGGIVAGFTQRSIDFDKLKWGNQYDGNGYNSNLPSLEPSHSNTNTFGDFGCGIQWNLTKGEMYATANNQLNINMGFAVFHVNQPNQSFYTEVKEKLPMKMVGHGSVMIGLKNSKMSVVPSFIYMQQGTLRNIIVGGSLRYKLIQESKYTGNIKGAALSLCGHYRVGDAFIPSIQLEIARYAIGISYDVNTSDLENASSGKGGIEISLRFVNPNPFTGRSGSTKSPRLFQ